MINPSIMCNRHLLGEHYECHMFAGCLNKGKSLKGYLNNNLFDPASLTRRHNELVEEMRLRGYTHNSPILKYAGKSNPINASKSLLDLLDRCFDCRKRYNSFTQRII
jgi:hypothetical protein